MLTKSVASVKNQLRQLAPYAKHSFSAGIKFSFFIK